MGSASHSPISRSWRSPATWCRGAARRRPTRSRWIPSATRNAASVSATPILDAEQHDTFRNELASVGVDGRRRWIYARQPAGRWYRARTAVSVLLLAFLFSAPFVTVGGQPLMMLNVVERKFV